jgi:hypothetical protein
MCPEVSRFWILTHLLAAVRGQIESEYSEEGDAHAGNDDVHSVEERLTAHCDVERDVQVRFIAAGVEFLVPAGQILWGV